MIVDLDLPTPTRGGVVLRADVYRPAVPHRVPAILVRTPYGKQAHRNRPFTTSAVERGFAVVVQDVRGRYGSAGHFEPYRLEGLDGYDAVEWIAAQPWCTGRVGTSGLSYPGAVQWLLAVEAPPHLACIFPAMCFSSPRQFFTFGGAFDLSWLPWTAVNIAPDERRRRGLPGPSTVDDARAVWRAGAREAFRRVPLVDQPLLTDAVTFYADWLRHPEDGAYWAPMDIEARHGQVTVPSFNFSGWHDEGYGPIGAVRNYVGVRARGGSPSARDPRLVIGPWTHGEPTRTTTRVGSRDFGPEAGLDYDALVLDWCDWHLRGVDRGLAAQPPVRVFVMGANRWRESRQWPLEGRRTEEWFLRGGGRLSRAAPASSEAPDAYTFDPGDPVEDPHYDAGLGAHDQRAVAQRADVLMFESDPLPEDLEVIGPIEFRLWVASSAPDTDFYARLLDVEPGGAAWNLMSPTLEVLRARFRHSEVVPEPLVPGVPTEITLRLGLTANRFLRGHRIAVQVTSSFFPHLDRNPNTGEPGFSAARLVAARQRVFHDAGRPSRVVLPVVEP